MQFLKKNVPPLLLQKARDLHREHQALQQQEADREVVAELLQHHGNGKPVDAQRRQEALQHYATCREERVQDFLRALKHKRDSYFSGLWSETVSAWESTEEQTPCLSGGDCSLSKKAPMEEWRVGHLLGTVIALLIRGDAHITPMGL